jgi:hypothetical protein
MGKARRSVEEMEMSIKSATGLGNPAGDSQGSLGANFHGALGKNPAAIISALNQQYASSGEAVAVLKAAAQYYKETKSPEYDDFAQSFYADTVKPNHPDDKNIALGILGDIKRLKQV